MVPAKAAIGCDREANGPTPERNELRVAAKAQSRQAAPVPWAHLRLPPFPQVAVRVLQLTNNENVQLRQLCDLISTDPAFATEILTVANSAFYCPRYPSTSISQAVAVIGATRLQGMCVTVGVRAYLGKAMNLPAMRNLWRHNLACAMIAHRLAAAGGIDPEMAYTAGILHDIGRMALAVLDPNAYAELLEAHRGTSDSILAAERDLFGFDHCETGSRLVADWKLPENFKAAVADHLSARRADGAWDTAELVKVSCAMASAVSFPAFSGCAPARYDDLLEQLPARERGAFQVDAGTLRQQVAESIHAVEAA